MNVLGKNVALQVLRGKIRSLNSISVDRSLSVDGASADAKAAGDGIAEAKRITNEHIGNKSNPHGVTKAQLGLNNVDNTSDMDKPVSTLQAAAIADAKKAGTDAQTAGGSAQSAADKAQRAADRAQAAADAASAAAEDARAAADNAQATADSKTAWFTEKITLFASDWENNQWNVIVPGVTEDESQPIIITPDPDSAEDYTFFGIKPVAQKVDGITFSCETVPDVNIKLNVVGFTVPVKEV